ncbi:glutamine--tRNA ligase/YqeY domain fusion protein [Alphaproteobacteria bacterium]|jgi:glutaminyl-tRNA synthetase|nr:glutamine--tRNA ligase/YqeY domain fusion protein [Alphaproteobacteria bacterium]
MNDQKAEIDVEEEPSDFIRTQIRKDIAAGKQNTIVTRFPPEPNGYLHLGHAKSICLNFGVAAEYDGRCHLRLDDTNPAKEDEEYIEAIKEDVQWLGFDWGDHLHFASDNFDQLYQMAISLIDADKAYIDDLSAEEIRDYRGTLTEPGRDSPNRYRTPDENKTLFMRMKNGEFKDGQKVLRAKIDMSSANMNMRDPILVRIVNARHPRTGDEWKIYPTYDFAHGQSDAIEGVTHSLCTLEFEGHRPLYEWLIENLPVPSRPHQYEFSRLNISHTVLSKRRLMQLVQEGHVSGWDDPRMPTLRGLRRRGVPPQAIRNFIAKLSISKNEGVVEMAAFDFEIREYLNRNAERRLAVLNPLKVVIENYPEGQAEELEAVNNPQDAESDVRMIPFSREIYVERGDFMEDPPKKFFRLGPNREVRLRFAYFITCIDMIKDESGEVVELRCTYDPETKGGNAPDGRKVKGTIHWVSAPDAIDAEVRLYDPLFSNENPGSDDDFVIDLNPASLAIQSGCKLEPSLCDAAVGQAIQFERTGYFCVDGDSTPQKPVFNRTIALRDSWEKMQKK